MIDCHLKAIEIVNNLANVRVDDTYVDDHLLCCDATLELKDGRSCSIPFMWVGWEAVASLEYFDSPRARFMLINTITQRIDMALDDLADFEDAKESGEIDDVEDLDSKLAVAAFFDITKDDLS